MLGNSDIHGPSPTTPWKPEDHRTLTMVFAPQRSLDAIQAALVDGRTAVWCQNRLYGREPELAALFAASVRVRPPHHRTKEHISFRIDNACELDLELERTGTAGPKTLRLPARSGTMVRLRVPTTMPAEGMSYKVTNVLIGPDQPLPVQLVVPPQ
ncbi:MAG: hypothetical protein JXB13_20435 [Phycisphaerae bacterium]|nr:hypothetical protein [Phycisphaerae bacterium]